MKIYTHRNQACALAHDIVNDDGQFGVEPADVDSFVAGSWVVVSNAANNLTFTANTPS